MSTAEVTVLVAAALGVAWVAHRLGRSATWRARLRRRLRHPVVVWVAVGCVVAGSGVLALLPPSQEEPRRYADYLPDDGAGAATTPLPAGVLAVLLIGGGVILTAVWWWLRYGGLPGRRGTLPQYGLPVVGGLLLLAGLVGDWIADRTAPPTFGWYLYSPLAAATSESNGLAAAPHITHSMAVTLGALGLGVLTALMAFRAGRSQTTPPDELGPIPPPGTRI